MLLVDRFDPIGLQDCVARERATLLGAVPVMYQRMLEAGLAPEKLASLRFAFSAGAALDVETSRATSPRALRSSRATARRRPRSCAASTRADASARRARSASPCAFGELRIADERGREVPRGARGEVVVRGPIVMLGYWRRPEETAQSRIDGWHRTGDLGVSDDDGFVTLVGRLKELYISGGENVYPAEVERVLGATPGRVGGRGGRRAGRALGRGRPRLRRARARAVRRRGRCCAGRAERLARYKLPREVVVVAELPRTASGKVQKHALLART